MNTLIYHSVNCGLFFWADDTGLWVDGIHSAHAPGFSPMPPCLSRQLQSHTGFFAQTDGLLFSHVHEDHFCRAGLRIALDVPDPPVVYGPNIAEANAGVKRIAAGRKMISMGAARIFSMKTVHDGDALSEEPHESFLLQLGGEAFFLAGDARLAPEQAEVFRSFGGGRVTAGFFNLYQLSDENGRAFIRGLNPGRVFLYHLPFPEDDCFSFHLQAPAVIRRYPADLPPVEVIPHMDWIDARPAPWFSL